MRKMPPEESPSGYLRLLRLAERYTKTDLTYLVGNGFWLSLSQVGIALVAFLLSIAFARFVPKDVYGNYRYLLSVFWTLTAFSLTGLPTAMARAIARGEDGAYGESFWLSMIWSWPMILISVGLAVYYAIHGNTLLEYGSLIIAFVGPFMQSTYLFGSFLEGKKAFKTNAIAGIVLNAVPAIALLVTMLVTKNPLAYLAVYLVGNAGTAAVISIVLWYRLRVNSTKSPDLFKLGGHFSIMNILNTVSSQVDRLLVYHYFGAVQLAIYTFATAMPDQIRNIFNNVATIAFPKFAQRSLDEISATIDYRMWGFAGLMAVVAIAYIVIAPLAFHLLFPAYVDSIFYSQIYAIGLIPIGSMIPMTVLQVRAANKELYVFNIVSSVFQIGILFPAIAWYGLLGAVVARIIARLFTLLLGQASLAYHIRQERKKTIL